ncbi:hypothetical protein IV203_038289 [Nitzschia inconspicua]|uniref:Uncharacterized protein n=1 Tax=Nitzschia inconspicua TaxID=303405 RepID=A0A9K3LR54_9STRA|nr:hypothetical protein IV203_038289 [Nitzschia inconspicua]
MKIYQVSLSITRYYINTTSFCQDDDNTCYLYIEKMKLSLAFVALTGAVVSANPFAPAKSSNNAKAKYMNKLVAKAKPTENSQLRRLEDNQNNNQQQEGEDYYPDISSYSLKFQQCQFVKSYNDDLAGNEDSTTVLATKRFVVFRLCPSDACDSCNSNFGEYIVDLESYLQATVEYQQAIQEEMCQTCQACGNWENQQQADEQQNNNQGRRLQNGNYVDCDSCYDECMKIENMEANGYIDATNFMECQMIYDPEDDGKSALFAGPMCASGGSKIKVGVFEDEECNIPDLDKDVDDYLMDGQGVSMKLSHALLKTVYSSDCISCLWVDENQQQQEEQQQNDDQNQDQNQNNNRDANNNKILDMCEQLYDDAAKCEKTNAFDNGYSNYYGYENQLAQEVVVCDFIASLKAGSYDETGEIVVYGANSAIGGGAQTTGGQKFALTFFILGTVGLAGYAAMLHSKLTKGSATLSDQGGAMA